MGKILSSKRNENGIVFEVEVDVQESTLLGGHYDNVHLFSENISEFYSNISTRGRNCATKYFLIPKVLRKDININCPVSCQKIETNDRILFIYGVDRCNEKD